LTSQAITVRTITAEEVKAFDNRGYDPDSINWAVCLDDEPVVYFSAEPEAEGWLEIHCTALRHRLHPHLIIAYAKSFARQLLDRGFIGLIANIAPANRASIWLGLAVGFKEIRRNSQWVTMVYTDKDLSQDNPYDEKDVHTSQ